MTREQRIAYRNGLTVDPSCCGCVSMGVNKCAPPSAVSVISPQAPPAEPVYNGLSLSQSQFLQASRFMDRNHRFDFLTGEASKGGKIAQFVKDKGTDYVINRITNFK